ARQLRRPPDILITTPESLYLLLTSRKGAPIFNSVRYVIVDEIHALAGSKRGTHLALSLERLEEVVGRDLAPESRSRFVRIGLSATQRPREAVARLLGGWDEDGTPRPVSIVRAQEPKAIELDVVYPFADSSEQGEFMQRAAELVLEELPKHRSMLVFCNARHSCERLAELVNQLAEAPIAMAHHGSIARERRFQIEQDLKAGRLPLLIATSSLELGIDIGAVDFVLQLASPKSVNRAMQRLGRAGHAVGAASRGRIIARFPADLLDAAACARGVRERSIEATHIPAHCLDVLAQQVVAMAGWQAWPVGELLRVVRRADPFHSLSRAQLENVLAMLDGRYGDERFSDLRPRLVWDEEAGEVQPRPGGLRMALVNGGTIPDRGYFAVEVQGEGAEPNRKVGELDEEFASELYVGGRPYFALGTSVWGVQSVDRDRVLVRPAPGEMFQIPFWRGERLDRSIEYGTGRLTREVAARLGREPEASTAAWLEAECCLAPTAATALLAYVRDQVEATGEVPSDRAIVVETFQDEIGDGRLVIHSLFGGRVNGAWAFALRPRLREALGGIDPLVLYNDDGIIVRLPPMDRQPPLEVLEQVRADTVEEFLIGELADAPMLALRFRESAQRALLLPRKQPGRRNPLWLRRQKAADLLSIVRRKMGFPVLQEAVRECLHDTWDLNGLRHVLRGIESGEIGLTRRETASPSPFAASLVWEFGLAFAELGDAPRGECRAAYLALNRDLLRETLETEDLRGLIDPVVLAELEADLARQAEQAGHGAELAALRERAGRASGRKRDEALQLLLHRALQYLPPLNEGEIARRLDLEVAWTRRQLNVMVEASQLCRGEYRPEGRQPEYCVPRLLTRLHRDSLRRAREQLAPVSPEEFAAFLPRWHGLGTGAAMAPRQALARLRYLALPRENWQTVLAARLGPSWQELVDSLTSRGALHWRGTGRGRLELVDTGAAARQRPASGKEEPAVAEVRTLLMQRGALFSGDAARLLAATGVTPSQTAGALRALEDAGEAANDLFSGAGRWHLLKEGAAFGRESAATILAENGRSSDERRLHLPAKARPTSGGPRAVAALSNAAAAGDQASESEQSLELYADALLQRYGVVAR
ncbi:MAG TPA: helicase-related protein, partial [Chloroflexota bacterium]|nr:helicase-related protein [Chloroflexota bacterium]